jgi:hypothetical protein
MWILGLFAYYLFHMVAIVYYTGMFTKGTLERPMASIYSWFHPTVLTVSAVLFILSVVFFYISSPWLMVAPIVLLCISLIRFRIKQGSRTTEIIRKATEIQVKMEREGRPQTEINKAIYLGATGKIYPIEWDADLKSFLRCSVLREVIGFDTHEDFAQSIGKMGDPNYVSASDKIDAAVDHFYQYWCQCYDTKARYKI